MLTYLVRENGNVVSLVKCLLRLKSRSVAVTGITDGSNSTTTRLWKILPSMLSLILSCQYVCVVNDHDHLNVSACICFRMGHPNTKYQPNGSDVYDRSSCASVSLVVTSEQMKSGLPGQRIEKMFWVNKSLGYLSKYHIGLYCCRKSNCQPEDLGGQQSILGTEPRNASPCWNDEENQARCVCRSHL